MYVDPLSSNFSTSQDRELNDEQLITSFIDGIIHGARPLKANKNLRVEPVFNCLQLLSNREGIIATVHLRPVPIWLEVRTGTAYFEQIHEILSELQYLPYERNKKIGAYQYRYCECPAGYELRCTIAKELWRASWGRGFSSRVGIPLDLIVWQPELSRQEPWQSLVGMDCDRGKLQIKMLGRSVNVDSTDLIVWAKSNQLRPRSRAQTYHASYRGQRF